MGGCSWAGPDICDRCARGVLYGYPNDLKWKPGPVLKFSHSYFKMPRDSDGSPVHDAILLHVFKDDSRRMSPEFVAYDTNYDNGRYPLPTGDCLFLLLLSQLPTGPQLWTTIRRWTRNKEKYYRSLQGQEFRIEIAEE